MTCEELIGVMQVRFAAQLESFLGHVKKQREQLLDLSADVQLQVNTCDCSSCFPVAAGMA